MTPHDITIFASLDDENAAEVQRRAGMTPAERCREFAAVQARRWGTDWTERPIEKIWSMETIAVKQRSGRLKDNADAEELLKSRQRNITP